MQLSTKIDETFARGRQKSRAIRCNIDYVAYGTERVLTVTLDAQIYEFRFEHTRLEKAAVEKKLREIGERKNSGITPFVLGEIGGILLYDEPRQGLRIVNSD